MRQGVNKDDNFRRTEVIPTLLLAYLFAVVVHVDPLVHHRSLHDVAGGLLAQVALGGVGVVLRHETEGITRRQNEGEGEGEGMQQTA